MKPVDEYIYYTHRFTTDEFMKSPNIDHKAMLVDRLLSGFDWMLAGKYEYEGLVLHYPCDVLTKEEHIDFVGIEVNIRKRINGRKRIRT